VIQPTAKQTRNSHKSIYHKYGTVLEDF